MRTHLKWYSFRWQVGVAILLVLILPAATCWYSQKGKYIHPIGSGPAGFPVSAQLFEHPWSARKVVLIGLGDSITAGYGASEGHGYFDLLVKNDNSRYPEMKGRDLSHAFTKLLSHNHSISGTISQEHLTDQVPGVQTYPSDVLGVVVITTGGNDIIHDYGKSPPRDGAAYGCTYDQGIQWKETFRKRLKGIIEGTIARFPGGCEIFLANIYDPTDGIGDIHNAHAMLPRWPDGLKVHAEFNKVIAEAYAKYPNVHLVDIHSVFLGHGIHCENKRNKYYRADDPHYWYYENLEDPNDRGYDAIRRAFLIEMAEVFDKTDMPAQMHLQGEVPAEP